MAEIRYLGEMAELDNHELKIVGVEFSLVRAGVEGGFANTKELKVMNYKEAMQSPDKAAWEEEIKNKYNHFVKLNMFTVVPQRE